MSNLSKYEHIDLGGKGYPVDPELDKLYSEYRPELEDRSTVTIKTTKGRLRSLSGGSFDAYATRLRHRDSGIEKDIVVIPHNVSTKTRVHELVHLQTRDPSYQGDSPENLLRRELQATIVAKGTRGKRITVREVLAICDELVQEGYSPNRIMAALKSVSKEFGIKPSKEITSAIWWGLRDISRE